MAERKQFVDASLDKLSLRKQCDLLSVNRSSLYYLAKERPIDEASLMNLIREHWLSHPFYGYRKITCVLRRGGIKVNRKRVQRLMRVMGIQGNEPRQQSA